ncbi:putative glucan 1,3-beta-glucosidase [Helianthus annuus]|nr:putative glucan 1,3-beta-glucosidase [Helianthus annuus]
MHANRYLVTDFLKNKLKFRGFVISDWQGIDRITTPEHANYTYSIIAGMNTSIDMVWAHADNLGYQCGGWTIEWQGLSGDITSGTTILSAVKRPLTRKLKWSTMRTPVRILSSLPNSTMRLSLWESTRMLRHLETA